MSRPAERTNPLTSLCCSGVSDVRAGGSPPSLDGSATEPSMKVVGFPSTALGFPFPCVLRDLRADGLRRTLERLATALGAMENL